MNNTISLEQAKEEFKKIQIQISSLEQKLGHECENIDYDRDDLDQKFMKTQYYFLADKLNDISGDLKYLSKDIIAQGPISHNSAGRYELPSGDYLTSGSPIEILNRDSDGDEYWVLARIEHNGNDYYATTLGRNKNIDGMTVRLRA